MHIDSLISTTDSIRIVFLWSKYLLRSVFYFFYFKILVEFHLQTIGEMDFVAVAELLNLQDCGWRVVLQNKILNLCRYDFCGNSRLPAGYIGPFAAWIELNAASVCKYYVKFLTHAFALNLYEWGLFLGEMFQESLSLNWELIYGDDSVTFCTCGQY